MKLLAILIFINCTFCFAQENDYSTIPTDETPTNLQEYEPSDDYPTYTDDEINNVVDLNDLENQSGELD
ncbi:MAG: hypothetical protein H6622_16815 [Halobacteriovoraceae bacterium]|nr:hypothetical protein [Halobacteriovoraceae bacterium]